jgi:hypothetical protein
VMGKTPIVDPAPYRYQRFANASGRGLFAR